MIILSTIHFLSLGDLFYSIIYYNIQQVKGRSEPIEESQADGLTR